MSSSVNPINDFMLMGGVAHPKVRSPLYRSLPDSVPGGNSIQQYMSLLMLSFGTNQRLQLESLPTRYPVSYLPNVNGESLTHDNPFDPFDIYLKLLRPLFVS